MPRSSTCRRRRRVPRSSCGFRSADAPPRGCGKLRGMAQLEDVQLADHDLFADRAPLEVFARLREHAPVYWNPEPAPRSGFWAITRYEDVVMVLKDTETFSSELGGITLEEPSEA